MMRVLIVALLASNAVNEASAASNLRRANKPLTSFETSCYHAKSPPGEKGAAKGRGYRGLVSTTTSGRNCQKWTDDHPWAGAAKIKAVADDESDDGLMTWGNGIGNHNYCRNPDGRDSSPWPSHRTQPRSMSGSFATFQNAQKRR